ncbi:hypothetical protein D3C79_830220 [compost metagenome]
MQGHVVFLFMATGMHAQTHVVTRVGAQHRCERIPRFGARLVDVRREQCGATGRADCRGDRCWRQVHRRNGAVGTALHGECEVTAKAIGLHPTLAVRGHFVRVIHPQRQWLVTVVDDEHAWVIHRDGLRARP